MVSARLVAQVSPLARARSRVPEPRAVRIAHLAVDVRFAKRVDWHERCAFGQCNLPGGNGARSHAKRRWPREGRRIRPLFGPDLDKPLAVGKGEVVCAGMRVQGLLGAADDQEDGRAGPAVEVVPHRLARGVAEADGEQVLAVEGHAEEDVEGEDPEVDAREELRKQVAVREKVGGDADADDAVRVGDEEVSAVRREVHRLDERHGEVGPQRPPDAPVLDPRDRLPALGRPLVCGDAGNEGRVRRARRAGLESRAE